jgi:transposase
MTRYIGIDVHRQSCTIAVVGPSGKRPAIYVVETNAHSITTQILQAPTPRHICLEEGTHSLWLHEILSPLAEELVVVIPKKRTGNKSDERDAIGLAQELRTNAITRRVVKAPKEMSRLRDAVRGQMLLTQDSVRVKNRINAIFRARGIPAPTRHLYDETRRANWSKSLPSSNRRLADLLGKQLVMLEELKDEASEDLDEVSHGNPAIKLLRTVPGIGPIRAAQIVSIVMSPHRFRSKRQLWAYCGLGVVMHSSADWVVSEQGGFRRRIRSAQTRGLNHGNPTLKSVFKNAAMQVVTKMTDHPLAVAYQEAIARKIDPRHALLTLARKIAAAVLAIWKKNEEYDPSKHRRQTT